MTTSETSDAAVIRAEGKASPTVAELIITRGVPAAGKTTWARAWVAECPSRRTRVNRDDLRMMLWGIGSGLSREQEEIVTLTQREAVKAHLRGGLDVVADDTNLDPSSVQSWLSWTIKHGFQVTVRDFPVELDVALARNEARGLTVPPQVIVRMHEDHTDQGAIPSPDFIFDPPVRPYRSRPDLPPAILVDIDGTLALRLGDRLPYDVARVHEDTPNGPVVEALRFFATHYTVVLLSARDLSAHSETLRWLRDHEIPFDHLHMRRAGDLRKDSIVKLDLFNRHVRDAYDVRMVLDDRTQVVVQMWRSLGLSTWQVNPGDF